MFPRQRPVGCARMPVVPPEEDWRRLVDGVGREGEAGSKNSGEKCCIDEMWNLAVTCTEAELCGLCDFAANDGGGNAKYMGRSKGAVFMMIPVRPKRRSRRLGMTDIVTHGLEWMAGKVREMGC